MNSFSDKTKFSIILAIVLGVALSYFGYTALGGTNIATTLNLFGIGTTLDDGLVAHWTFDGVDVLSVAGSSATSTITFDNETSATCTNCSSDSISHTTGSGNNRILIFAFEGVITSGVSSVTYNGTALTKIREDNNVTVVPKTTELWYLLNPDSGSHTLSYSFGGTTVNGAAIGTALTLEGVSQIMGPDASTGAQGQPASASFSNNITTNTDYAWIVDIGGAVDDSDGMGAGAGQTGRWNEWIDSAGGRANSFGSTEPTTAAGTYAMSWSGGANLTLGYTQTIAAFAPATSTSLDGVGFSDRSGNDSTISLSSGLGSSTVPGPIGQALSFDGTSDYATVAALGSGLRTISFWMRADDNTSRKVINIDGTDQIELNGSGQIAATSFPGTTNIYINGESGTQTTEGQWHHVVITDTTGVNGSSFELGRVASSYFDGALDDVRIFNRVLSEDEIKQLYRQGATTKVATTLEPTGSAVSLDDDLVGHWTFDGPDMDIYAATDHVLDRSGQGNHGTMANFPATTTVPGVLGQALNFTDGNNGASDEVQLGIVHASPDNWTWALWIRPMSTSGAPSIGLIGEGNNPRLQWTHTGTTDPRVHFGAIHAGDLSWASGPASSNLSLDTWYHAAVTVEGASTASPVARLYIDGVEVDNRTYTEAIRSSNGNMYLNRRDTLRAYEGYMDDVRAYERALSPDEIKQLYRMGATTKVATTPEPAGETVSLDDGLAGHWTMDGPDMQWQTTGAEVRDHSGQTNHGSITGSLSSQSAVIGQMGQALSFNGSDDYVLMPTDTVNPVSSVSYAAWWKLEPGTHPTDANFNWVVNYDQGTGQDPYAMKVDSTGTEQFQCLIDTLVSGAHTASLVTEVEENRWYHQVCVYDAVAGTLTNYVDGVQIAQETSISGNLDYNTGGTQALTIGSDPTSASGAHYFFGTIDDVRVYDRPLSLDEIAQLYRMGN